MNQIIPLFSILLLSVVMGFIIARKTKDELRAGEKWFKILIVLGILIGIINFMFRQTIAGASCFGISLIALISYLEGKKLK